MNQRITTTQTFKITLIVSSLLALISCSATQTALEHRSLEVSTNQSETVFLDPVPPAKKIIYIAIKNTSDQNVDITPQLKTTLIAHGYRITSDPSNAHYLLQANILTVGKMSRTASQSALGGGYGSAIAGGVAGVG